MFCATNEVLIEHQRRTVVAMHVDHTRAGIEHWLVNFDQAPAGPLVDAIDAVLDIWYYCFNRTAVSKVVRALD